MFVDVALHEERGDLRVEAGGEEIECDLGDIGPQLAEVGVVGGEGVEVGDEEIAVVFVLEPDPVVEGSHVIAEVQLAGRPHAAKNALARERLTHSVTSRTSNVLSRGG